MFHLDPLGHLEVEGMVKYMSNTDILRDDHQKHLRYLKMTDLFWILFSDPSPRLRGAFSKWIPHVRPNGVIVHGETCRCPDQDVVNGNPVG